MKLYIVMILAFLSHSLTHAAGKVWQHPLNIGFEIRNHDSKPITVTLKYAPTLIIKTADPLIYLNPDDSIIWKTTVNGKKIFGSIPTLATPVDIREQLYLIIEYADKQGNPTFKYYRFAPNKTVFVAWENQQLRPQKGKGGITQSGFSLANNITLADIESYDINKPGFPSEAEYKMEYQFPAESELEEILPQVNDLSQPINGNL